MLKNLLTCEAGIPCRVVKLGGGGHFRQRLQNLGITEGKIVTRVHSHPFRGPVTIRLSNAEIAIGHGMARRIEVEKVV